MLPIIDYLNKAKGQAVSLAKNLINNLNQQSSDLDTLNQSIMQKGMNGLSPKEKQLFQTWYMNPVAGMTSAPTSQLKAPANLLISHEGAPDLQRVNYYANKIFKGEPLKPLKIIREGAKYGIEEGKHRFAAYQSMGIKDIPVELIDRVSKFVQNPITGRMMGRR